MRKLIATLTVVSLLAGVADLAAFYPEGVDDKKFRAAVRDNYGIHIAGGQSGRALYFTRSTLYGDAPVWRHIGIYGYRRDALMRFNAAAPSPLERREKLEQLRALELGLSIWAAVADAAPISVDTQADLDLARGYAEKAP